ncbi:MAG: 30S ribosomal protein S8 [Candidatus Dadabacteria bacterium]
MTDPIADMLTRIRNALINRYSSVEIPTSRIKAEIARVLKEEGYIGEYSLIEDGIKKTIKIELKYTPEKESVITEIRRISRPSCRVYVNKNEIPKVKGGLGISILSTSKGIMTGIQARRYGVGGELICTIW